MFLRNFEKGGSIEGYASNLAYILFKGVIRDTGLPYTHDHLARLAMLVDELTLNSNYKSALVAAAWLHDSVEDIDFIGVHNPFCSNPNAEKGKISLNKLLKDAEGAGQDVCYIVDLMTYRGNMLYQEYVDRIFNFPSDSREKDLHVLTAVLKMADISLNTNPDERKNVNSLVAEYFKLREADEETLEEFYSKTKTIDSFKKKGNFEFDVGLFVESLMEGFRQKQRARAIDNVAHYLPLAEKKLLMEIGADNKLFCSSKLRKLLKKTYINSLCSYPGSLYDVERIGLNKKAPKVSGYKPILKEIRKEVAEGLYKV